MEHHTHLGVTTCINNSQQIWTCKVIQVPFGNYSTNILAQSSTWERDGERENNLEILGFKVIVGLDFESTMSTLGPSKCNWSIKTASNNVIFTNF